MRKIIVYFAIFVSMLCFTCCRGEDDDILITSSEADSTDDTVLAQTDTIGNIFVYVSGEVVKEGVYELRNGARLFEAIEAAGGFTKKADKSSVNLALEAIDGQHIMVSHYDKSGQVTSGGTTEMLVNINTADADMLMSLNGIGQSKADSIIAYRNEHGSFQTIEEIMQVAGIKEAAFSKIKDKITVK